MNDPEQKPIPAGFKFSGISAGLKEKSSKDLGLIYCEKNAILGAVYTKNRFPSAHVQYCKSLTPADNFRALIINSGNANAATGQAGIDANLKMASNLADILKVDTHQVFTSSTGIIGRPFPIDLIERSLAPLVNELCDSSDDVSKAIMTTDTRQKQVSTNIWIDESEYTITGFAKGSGMIHPNMGTMLAYITTDAPIQKDEIQNITVDIANHSFNCVSVDGDTSTNDSFFLISSNPVDKIKAESTQIVKTAITDVAIALAKKIAADGEGAEHLIEVNVKEAVSYESAHTVMHSILTSNLVKTAINGKDPNWGRILMAVGNGIPESVIAEKNFPVSITIQDVNVFHKGEPLDFDEAEISNLLNQFFVRIEVNLYMGDQEITGWGCDFSDEYIRINADYST